MFRTSFSQLAKKLVVLFALFFILKPVQAQEISLLVEPLPAYRDSISDLLLKYSFPIKQGQKPHDLYIGLSWESSLLLTRDGKILPFVGRFNVVSSLVEMKVNAQVFAFDINRIKAVYIGGRLFVPVEGLLIKGQEKNSFVEILTTGNLLCYYDLNSSIENSSDVLTSSITGKTSYRLNPIYYSKNADGDIQKLAIANQKQLDQFFQEFSPQISDYIKTNKLKRKKERDLIILFKYYNELLDQ